jgi:flagellin
MALDINVDLASLQVASSTFDNYAKLLKAIQRLSSGRRINCAADNPAGLVISERLRAQINSLYQEIENTSALINRFRYAGSTVGELRRQAVELRTLAVGAANSGVNDEASQLALSRAADYIVGVYNRTIDEAVYNGAPMLDGSERALTQVGKLESIDLSSAQAAEVSLTVIDEAIAELDSVQIELAAVQENELASRRSMLTIAAQNLQAAQSVQRDTDYAIEVANMVSQMIRLHASMALLSHTGIGARSVLKLLSTE